MSASRERVEPGTLVTVKLGMPISLALTNTWRLSAVSPDWLIKMKSGFLLRSGIPYPHSDEIPSSTGVSVNSSNIFLEANPAW